MPQNNSGTMVGTSKLRYLFNEERGLEVAEVVPSQASEGITAIKKTGTRLVATTTKKNQHFSILISSPSRSFCRHNDDQEERSA